MGMQDATANALLQLNDEFVKQQQQIQKLSSARQPLGELPINTPQQHQQHHQPRQWTEGTKRADCSINEQQQ